MSQDRQSASSRPAEVSEEYSVREELMGEALAALSGELLKVGLFGRGESNFTAAYERVVAAWDALTKAAALPTDTPATGEVERNALQKAGEAFREYAAIHAAKLPAADAYDPRSSPEIWAKVHRNRELAEMCEQALTSPTASAEDVRNAVIEECAKVAEQDHTPGYGPHRASMESLAETQRQAIAYRIRALASLGRTS